MRPTCRQNGPKETTTYTKRSRKVHLPNDEENASKQLLKKQKPNKSRQTGEILVNKERRRRDGVVQSLRPGCCSTRPHFS